jgi:PAS domain S-box-containing protein
MASGPDRLPQTSKMFERLSLRQKTLLVVCITLAALVAGLYLVSRVVILRSFERLETEQAKEDMAREQSALVDDLSSLSRMNEDYNTWDATYDFVRGKNPNFPKMQFPLSTFDNLNVDVLMILDDSRHVRFSRLFDRKRGVEAPFSEPLFDNFAGDSKLNHRTQIKGEVSGVMMTTAGPFLVDSLPILTTDARGPVAGAIIMARRLNDLEIRHLDEVTHVPFTIDAFQTFQDEPLAHIFDDGSNVAVRRQSGAVIAAYAVINDIYGKPALVFTASLPRTMYQQGEASQLSFLVWLLASGLLFGAAVLYLLEKTVLSRVSSLRASVVAIGGHADLAARIEPGGQDEIGDLGREINRMLQALEQSQNQQRQQETRLRLLIERMPAVVWTTDTELRFTSSVGAGLEALRLTPNQVVGMTISEYLQAADRRHPVVAAHEAALKGRSSSFAFEWLGRTLHTHLEPLAAEDGSIVGVIGVSLDVTERASAEKALQRSESGYRSLIEEAPYGICRVGVDGTLLLVNRAMVRMLGYGSEQELLACSLKTDICRNQEDYTALIRQLEEREHVEGAEVEWKRDDGKLIAVRIGGRVVVDDSGAVCFEVIAEDVTERKLLGEQLRQAQKMQAVGQLAGGVAHDFNNLLMVMKGHAELLGNQLGEKTPLYKHVEQLEKAAERAAALTRQLLAFSRMQVLQPRVLDLNRVVEDMVQMIPRLVGENIELMFQPGANLGKVKADPGQVEQALLNLVVNARDAMPRGGRLTIETSNCELDESSGQHGVIVPPGKYVMLAVSDTGAGIPPEIQSRIFEPFFTTKEPGKGTGLGLSMVYGIVKQSGGFIWVYSEPGKGAAFKIYLPRVDAAAETTTKSRPQVGSLAGTETVLLVEDEESVRELVSNFLRDHGYKVLEAGDGEAALETVRGHGGPIHLLVTDVVMPKLSGRELALRLTKAHSELHVLFISGYTNDAVVRHGVLEGDMDFLQKPFTLKDLARKMREVLDRATTTR